MNGILVRCLKENNPVEIIYMADDHCLSQRKIQVLAISRTHIKAFCFLRRQKRTFKMSNILSASPVRSKNYKLHAN
ncbi:putative DNA-binding transcriptional regulator YafY [Peribacillus deserti]|uniref:DNA-binding transcriptional regulator YafY n=1 Tax=Peribacillus deserti TaxID=673318 RepID=A0ABS2QIQ3_9BACI|nr:hypothetical protein [Peribacillus deserti]MBM7693032.1 putative DNA-binding transcriptional regulator YafY [Peribacillus deserti]